VTDDLGARTPFLVDSFSAIRLAPRPPSNTTVAASRRDCRFRWIFAAQCEREFHAVVAINLVY